MSKNTSSSSRASDYLSSLASSALYHPCDLSGFGFESTESLQELDIDEQGLGQHRASDAFDVGLNIKADGYNLYAMGVSSASRHAQIKHLIKRYGRKGAPLLDWCYVHNFTQPKKPMALAFQPGEGLPFKNSIQQLVEDLQTTLPSTFESKGYQVQRQLLEQEFQERQTETMTQFKQEASEHNIVLLTTPTGFVFAPQGKNGEKLTAKEFEALPEQEKEELQKTIKELQQRLQETIAQFPLWMKEMIEKIKGLDRGLTSSVIENMMRELMERYQHIPKVAAYLQSFSADVVQNVRDFLISAEEIAANPMLEPPNFTRYTVNLFVQHDGSETAPVVYDDNPTHPNLLGAIEHQMNFGALTTNFSLLQAGSLHLASGGYLILDVDKLLAKPFAWEAIKRVLSARKVKMEPLEKSYGFAGTTLLEPEPIPIDVKVILLGDYRIYHLLSQYDPEFRHLFRIVADFEEQAERCDENHLMFARMLATIIRTEGLLHFDQKAVARMVEYASRLESDQQKMSLDREIIRNLLIEADYQARKEQLPLVSQAQVEVALEKKIFRLDRIREKSYEQIIRDTVLVDTEGEKVGQINGLAVYALNDFAFGRPSRITALVRVGSSGVIDIERQVDLGGPTHSKGVLILSSFLATRYTKDIPMSLSASLVFEQSYGGVDGDSASSTELYALLSALAEVPIKQSLAVTGSVNQLGQVQAIGGVNEKIEGFFDICRQRSFSGDQGVLIPRANVKHLMLRKDVREAVAQGHFHIYAVSHIDEGIEILTGMEAGQSDQYGVFPKDSLNAKVAAKLVRFAKLQKQKNSLEERRWKAPGDKSSA